MPEAKIGVIGGSGLYEMEGMTDIEEVSLETPFGKPSDAIIIGSLEGKRVAFLPRHGRGHRLSPSELPARANIFALKLLGVERIISVNSAGSFKEEIRPGDMVIPDQIIDRTTSRVNSFFGGGVVVHAPFADPFCPVLSQILYEATQEVGVKVHKGGAFVAMEGPSFSTRAESRLYRSWGASIIGMTVLPEARLAREAEMCYASLACVTDYDSWHERYEVVTADLIIETLHKNIDNAKRIIKLAVSRIPQNRECQCPTALRNAIVTKYIPEKLKRDLAPLISRYIP